MNKPSFVYVTYINAPPERVFSALTDPEMTRRYWSHHHNASDWKVGSKWEHRDSADPTIVDVVGKVLEVDPPHRMVWSWADPREADQEAKYSRVTYDIAVVNGSTRLTVTHENLEPDSAMLRGVSQGWPMVLSSLKSILETGEGLPGMDQCWKKRAAAAQAT